MKTGRKKSKWKINETLKDVNWSKINAKMLVDYKNCYQEGCLTKFYMGSLHPEVQPLTLLFQRRSTPFLIPSIQGFWYFAGFSGANSRKNRPISRDFRGKKVKTCGKIGRFRRIFAGKSQNSRKNPPISREKSQNSQENRPISRHFSGKSQISKDFQGQIHRKIGRFHGETSPRNNQ